jgi:hypothetical protein
MSEGYFQGYLGNLNELEVKNSQNKINRVVLSKNISQETKELDRTSMGSSSVELYTVSYFD